MKSINKSQLKIIIRWIRPIYWSIIFHPRFISELIYFLLIGCLNFYNRKLSLFLVCVLLIFFYASLSELYTLLNIRHQTERKLILECIKNNHMKKIRQQTPPQITFPRKGTNFLLGNFTDFQRLIFASKVFILKFSANQKRDWISQFRFHNLI